MKHIINILLAVLFVGSVSAQKMMDKGVIKMEMKDISSTGTQSAEMGMLKGTEMEIQFEGQKFLTSISLMGGMMNMSTLVDKSTNKTDIIINAMGQKMWAEETLESAKDNDLAKASEGMIVKYDESDTKEILGYKTKKALITRADAPNMIMTAYVTEEIAISSEFLPGLEDLKLKGFPLEINIDNNGTTMTIVTTAVSDTVDASKFTLDTTGAQKISMKDLGGMMGGMGM